MENEEVKVTSVGCAECDYKATAKTAAAAKAKVTRHQNEKHDTGEAPGDDLGKRVEDLTKTVENLAAVVALQEKNEEILLKKLNDKEEILAPSAGPGPPCEAYKVHMGEAWVLRKIEGDDRYEPIPAGYILHPRDGTPYLVKEDKPDEFVSNCRSMYTEEYEYKGAKKPTMVEYPIYKAYLCKGHADTLLGKSLESEEGNVTVEQTVFNQ